MFEDPTVLAATVLSCVFLLSATLCWFAVRCPQWFLDSNHMLGDTRAAQALHSRPTPRIGGVAVIVGFGVGLSLLSDRIGPELLVALAAGGIVFLAGMKEDISRNVSPLARLGAAFASAVLAVVLSSVSLPGLGLDQVDWVFGLAAVSIGVTVLWSAGTCHAINLIDGLNGLSASYAITAAVGLIMMAGMSGQTDIQLVGLLLVAALAGFLLFNWPSGSIFMGDAGAYAIGHCIAWLGLVLLARSPDTAGTAVLLILFWPVADTLFSILRRRLHNKALDRPDKLHFHHLVLRTLKLMFGRRYSKLQLNSLATAVLIPFFAVPVLSGVLLWNRPGWAFVTLVAFSLLFASSYSVTIRVFSRRGIRARLPQGDPAQRGRRRIGRSRYSGIYIQDSTAIDVQIWRPEGDQLPWRLRTEVADATGRTWQEAFATESAAWECFLDFIEREGVDAAIGLPVYRAVPQAP